MLDRVRHLRYNVREDNTQPTERIDTMANVKVGTVTDTTMEVVVTCRFCDAMYNMTVGINDYFEWLGERKHIQDAMPYLKPAERELLISHTCQDCWDRMFGQDEEEEVFVSDEDGFITLSELDIDDFINKFF